MVAAITMVKDEADIVEAFVQHTVSQVDWMLVADNGSTDGTREILDELARELPLEVIDDPVIAYQQSEKMSRLAAIAANRGAHWVVPADADECWYSPFGRVADVLDSLDAEIAVATAKLYDHVATGIDRADGSHIQRIAWRRSEPLELPKVACRPLVPARILTGNHGAHFPIEQLEGQLVVRHYPYRSVAQFVSKVRNGAAALAASNLPEHQGAHWRDYGRLLESGGEAALGDVFRRYFWARDPRTHRRLIRDACPTSP